MIYHLVGARPNFMKLAPLYNEMNRRKISQKVIHSGQHYDHVMSEVFFSQLGIPLPEFNLEIGSATPIQQIAGIMIELEKLFNSYKPNFLFVYGDVNSTMAGALVAAKFGVKLVHIESGLRSFDLAMPEEINRLVTDKLANIHFTPSIDGNQNLKNEGVNPANIHLVGNIMIDTLVNSLNKISDQSLDNANDYGLITLHRPSNVDDPEKLKLILNVLKDISKKIKLIYPLHPRTKKNLEFWGMLSTFSDIVNLIAPLGYLEFLSLQRNAKFIITDSGGIQEEATYLNIPCLTMRENTERPVTVTKGSSTLIGFDYELLKLKVEEILSGSYKSGEIPWLWDGKTSQRICDIMEQNYLFT